MKKLIMLSLVSMGMFMPQLYSISVAEYIQQHGITDFVGKKVSLRDKGLGITRYSCNST